MLEPSAMQLPLTVSSVIVGPLIIGAGVLVLIGLDSLINCGRGATPDWNRLAFSLSSTT